jgi:hypothetical protein
MEEQRYYFKISPENLLSDLVRVPYTAGTNTYYEVDPCCPITATTTETLTGTTGVYTGLTYLLTGGTDGTSLLTGLTIPILFTETAIDIGYYSVFDGAVLQSSLMKNFLFSADTTSPYTYFFYNTSQTEFLKFLGLTIYKIDWGDGSPQQIVTSPAPIAHTYPLSSAQYEVTFIANSPWGNSTITKTITVPFTNVSIFNPQGTAYFTPNTGSWTGTPVSYDYIFTGDSNTNLQDFFSSGYTTTPFVVSGYTQSAINDLIQYGPKYTLLGGKFKVGVPVTGTSGCVGIVYTPNPSFPYTAYTIDNIDYYDYDDGTTIYIVNSSGFTSENLIMTAITKNEALMNMIDQPQIISNVFIERGKVSVFESFERIGEVDNLGDLQKYGYKFFKVQKNNL